MIINCLPQLLEQKEVSIRSLARDTGITYSTIWAMVHGRRRSVQLETLDAVCAALDVQPGDVYQRVATREKPPAVPAIRRSTPPKTSVLQEPRKIAKRGSENEWRNW